MHLRILDLDGSVTQQETLVRRHRPVIHDLRRWGPLLRLGCRRGRYRRFEQLLNQRLAEERATGPALTLYGSGDFHHVSLALVRRIKQPINLLVIDNHPDWMRGVPLMHCGSWLYHAARLENVRWIFHVGGDVDFDNGYRWLAPWRLLRDGKINVIPGVRRYTKGKWANLPHEPLRLNATEPASAGRLDSLLQPFAEELQHWPLYISLDKDVMRPRDAVVNWDSGHLELDEVKDILEVFSRLADYRLAGMDIVGDWSPVRCQGLFRKFLHWTEHPPLQVSPAAANLCNDATNLALLETMLVSPTMPAQPRRRTLVDATHALNASTRD